MKIRVGFRRDPEKPGDRAEARAAVDISHDA